jgi:hypothetical protein
MYLLSFGDGEIFKIDELDDGVLPAADDGIVDVVDISDPLNPLHYYGQEWHSVPYSKG